MATKMAPAAELRKNVIGTINKPTSASTTVIPEKPPPDSFVSADRLPTVNHGRRLLALVKLCGEITAHHPP